MAQDPHVTAVGPLVLIGRGSGTLADQISGLHRVLGGFAPLCLLRLFYRSGLAEADLRRDIAAAIGPGHLPVVSMVPVPSPDPDGADLSLEAVAVLAGQTRTHGRDTCGFPQGIRRGQFAFTTAMRAATVSGLVAESTVVMQGLGVVLQGLGAGFGDVVRMNRWYHAAGTKDEWEPSARAVARHYVEPGPIATAISLPALLPGNRAIQIELMAMLAEDDSPLPKRHSWPKGHWDWPIHLPYKHGLECNGLAFVGGQVSLDDRAEVIDPEDMRSQIARCMANIARVLAEFPGAARLVKLGIYTETPPRGFASDDPAAVALRQLDDSACPTVTVGFDYLSYPKMRVEIEAIAALTPPA